MAADPGIAFLLKEMSETLVKNLLDPAYEGLSKKESINEEDGAMGIELTTQTAKNEFPPMRKIMKPCPLLDSIIAIEDRMRLTLESTWCITGVGCHVSKEMTLYGLNFSCTYTDRF